MFFARKITANKITVNLNVYMFKFKNIKKITSMLIIFIISDVIILCFLIFKDFTEMEIIITKISIFSKTTI